MLAAQPVIVVVPPHAPDTKRPMLLPPHGRSGEWGRLSGRAALMILALVLALAPEAQARADERPQTIPALQQWRAAAGEWELGGQARVLIAPAERRRLRPIAAVFASDLRRLTGEPPAIVAARGAAARGGDIVLKLGARDPRLGREGYAMRVGDVITIRGRRPAGAFYGTRTVLQLLHQRRTIPAGRARDWPRYPERGLMVDAGRKYFTPAWFRDRIRELAYLKMNYLHLHLSDNQGFRIESTTHPEIVSADHLTKRQVRRLVALARRYRVTIVPEIDMPGHMEAALAAHPELRLESATGTPAASQLDITDPAALAFARDLIEEYIPLFPGPYWHTGADEYMPLVSYPEFPALAEHARATYGPQANALDAVHGFVNWVDELVRTHDKTLRVWHDELGGGNVVVVNPDIVVEWWTNFSPIGQPLPLAPQALLDQGHRVMNAGWFPTYYVSGLTASAPPRPDMRRAYEQWEVNEFYGVLYAGDLSVPPERVSADDPRVLGSKLHVWNDEPEAQTQEQIAAGIAPRLRVLAQKTWASPRLTATYEEFLPVADAIGPAP